MISSLPLVTFVIPTHNRADVLRDCLESVVKQTYQNVEVIVINDNSKDNTNDILTEYSNKYNFFTFYNNPGNGGNAARNHGVEMAKGEYIAFMDDDDICELNRIEEQMKPILNSNFKYNFTVSAFSIFNSFGQTTEIVDFLKPMQSMGFTVRWLIKKDLIIDSGGFDLNQPALQDVEFFWRMRENAEIFYINKPLINVRDSQISITKDPYKMINAIKRLLELHSDKMNEREQNLWLVKLCKKLSYIEDWSEYEQCLGKMKKNRMPITIIFLYITYWTRKNFILKIHTKIQKLYERIQSKFFRRRPDYYRSSI